jgi:hypothetical protein
VYLRQLKPLLQPLLHLLMLAGDGFPRRTLTVSRLSRTRAITAANSSSVSWQPPGGRLPAGGAAQAAGSSRSSRRRRGPAPTVSCSCVCAPASPWAWGSRHRPRR